MIRKPVVLVTCRQMQVELPKYTAQLEALGFEVLAPDLGARQQFSSEELQALDLDLVGIIAGDDELDARFFSHYADRLKVVIRWGIGMDGVDHRAAAEAGVVVRNTPGVFSDEVADAAMGYLLALARGLSRVDREVRRGVWPKFEGVTLSGSTIGIVGYGAIGRAIGRRAAAFGMKVFAFDPFVSSDPIAEMRPLNELAKQSRFVVLACPLTDDTWHIADADFFSTLSSGSFLINVARGPVVDESALIKSLESGHLAGAGLDVFEVEPLSANSPLRGFDGVVLGAHNGSNTREGVERASARSIEYLIAELKR